MSVQVHADPTDTKTPVILKRWVQDDRYKTLATHLRREGFDLKQTDRKQDVAVYEKTKGQYKGYEVIIIRNREEYTIAGKTVEAAEVYPSSEDWGTLGWTYPEYHRAIFKSINLLTSREQTE